jgi:HAUS augmin-like complex subunit 1
MDSPLISPAKARQAAIQAKDWACINSWLSRKYSPNSVPPFERNEDTLKTLLAIAAANDAADEEAALVHRAREEVIQALKERDEAEHPRKKEILENIEAHLEATGEKNVNDLAETTTVLGSSSTDTIELAHAIMELTRDEFDAANQVQKVESLQNYLTKEMDSLQKEVTVLLADSAYTAPAELSSQTMEWVRSAKMLGAKVNEYRDRIASLQRSVSTDGSTIPDLVAEEEKVIEIQESVHHLEKSIKAFCDLPPNLEDAKKEYNRLERELGNLTQERDELLEKAVSRG